MTWMEGLLTTKEAERALAAAGLPPDPLEWNPEQFDAASQVLDQETAKKRERSRKNE